MLSKQEIRQLGNKEMIDELQRSRRTLLKTQFDVRNGSSKEAHVVKNLKRYIARLQTITKEMNAAEMKAKPAGMEKTAAPAETATEAKKTPAKKAAAPKKTTTKAAAKTPAKKAAKAKTPAKK